MNTGTFETGAGRAVRIAEKCANEIDRSIAKMTDRVSGRFKAVGVAVACFATGFVAFDAIAGRVKEAIGCLPPLAVPVVTDNAQS